MRYVRCSWWFTTAVSLACSTVPREPGPPKSGQTMATSPPETSSSPRSHSSALPEELRSELVTSAFLFNEEARDRCLPQAVSAWPIKWRTLPPQVTGPAVRLEPGIGIDIEFRLQFPNHEVQVLDVGSHWVMLSEVVTLESLPHAGRATGGDCATEKPRLQQVIERFKELANLTLATRCPYGEGDTWQELDDCTHFRDLSYDQVDRVWLYLEQKWHVALALSTRLLERHSVDVGNLGCLPILAAAPDQSVVASLVVIEPRRSDGPIYYSGGGCVASAVFTADRPVGHTELGAALRAALQSSSEAKQ